MSRRATLLCAVAALLIVTSATGDVALQDPTRPRSADARKPDKAKVVLPTLQSVLMSADRRVAVIGGVVVSEGEEKSGIRLVSVRRNEVDVLIAGQGPFVLRLGTGQVQKETR